MEGEDLGGSGGKKGKGESNNYTLNKFYKKQKIAQKSIQIFLLFKLVYSVLCCWGTRIPYTLWE